MSSRNVQRGLSLIEVMVALAIAAILLFGLSQIFVGSKNVYRLQEGMGRVQENARFVLQYLENNVRMAGYMGCGNDVDLTNRAGSPPAFLNHLKPTTSGLGVVPINQPLLTTPELFQRPIEAFAYTGGSVDNQDPATGGRNDWTPPLPLDLFGTGNPVDGIVVKGSDVLVLRVVSGESTAMLGDFNIPNGSFDVADPTMVKAGQIYALTNCANARIFKASTGGANPVTANATDNLLFLTPDHSSTWTGTYPNMQFNQAGTQLNAEVHAAQYIVLYIGLRAADGMPVLTVQSGPDGSVAPVELADNVETMRLWFGVGDNTGNGDVAKFLAPNANDPLANLSQTDQVLRTTEWQKVLSVRVGLLMRSQDRANATPHTGVVAGDNVYRLFDATVTPPVDYRYRDVFTTTIALRNRLGNY